MAFLSVIVAALTLFATSASAVELSGDFRQGGLVYGKAEPGTKVTFEDRRLRVAEDGTFVFGFGRDAGARAELTWVNPTGSSETRLLTVEKRTYQIQRINGLPPKKVTPPEAVLQRIRSEALQLKEVRGLDSPMDAFKSRFIWPVKGRISGVFGSQRVLNGQPRRPHNGVDIAAPTGTPVVASADGRVSLVHEGMYFAGKTVLLDHGHGLTSVYIHLDSITAQQGHPVRQGDVIGTVGQTGRATGPHLHWGVTWFTTHVDPQALVPPMN